MSAGILSQAASDRWVRDGLPKEVLVKYLPAFDQIKRRGEISIVKDELRISFTYDNFVEIVRMLVAGIGVKPGWYIEPDRISFTYDEFVESVRALVAGVGLDSEWYLEQNQDVKTAIEEGHLQSPEQHFVEAGYFEGRIPFAPEFDEQWYLSEYPDVADLIERGEAESALHHFVSFGYQEGRSPSG
jgi:hypothetical protein